MNITLKAVSPIGRANFGQTEGRKARMIRMKAFWADKANAVLHPLGSLLACEVSKGVRIADVLASGKGVVIDRVTLVSGQVLPVDPPQTISMATCAHGWGCIACHSAHGSGIPPSRTPDSKPDPDGLVTNRFFYHPVTRQVFSLSMSCWGEYVQGLGAVSDARFAAPFKATATSKPVVAASKPVVVPTPLIPSPSPAQV